MDVLSLTLRRFSMKNHKFNSTFDKRMALINAVFDYTDYTGSAEEWLKKRNVNLDTITNGEIDLIVKTLKEVRESFK